MIKVSVIVPIYNMGLYLEQCLDSLVSQSMTDKEIICINDGSTDNTDYILRVYSKRYHCIKVINQENCGVGRTRNNGINFAQGEFVSFVDPDDWYPDEDILDYLYDMAKEENTLISGGSFSSYYNGNIKSVYDSGYTFSEDKKLKYQDYQWDYGYHRFIYNLDMLRCHKIYFPEYKRYQDPPFFVKAMLQAGEFFGAKKITYRYRIGHQNIDWTVEKTKDLLRGLIDNLKISRKYKLAKLHYNTVNRINNDFAKQISKHMQDRQVIELIHVANGYIDEKLLKEENLHMTIPYIHIPSSD